jgi:hypothetical protein
MTGHKITRFLVFTAIFLWWAPSVARAVNPNIPILMSQYARLLETYRSQTDKVTLSLAQYKNLSTLASQEEAVHDMRDFLLVRSDVISAHMTILQTVLSDRTSLNADWVASGAAKIETDKRELTLHRSRSDVAVDRIKADEEALWFLNKQKQFTMSADRAACLNAIGHTQEAIDSLQTIKVKIDTWLTTATMSETQRVEKQRGSDELGRTIAIAQSTLDGAKTQYERQSRTDSASLLYPQLRPTVLSSYASVMRGVQYAKELTQ